MNCKYFVLVFINLFYSSQSIIIADSTSVEVTFLSNCSFMLSSNDKNIVFDGLQLPGYYLSSDKEIENQTKLINLEEPFTKVDLLLTTHGHPDHFHAESCSAHLLNNPNSKMIINDQVNRFFQYDSNYTLISDQLIISNPEQYTMDTISIDDITIYVYPISHWGFWAEQNVYIVDLNGIKIYFSGDNLPESEEFSHYDIDKQNIDIAFQRFVGFESDENYEVLKNVISPKLFVPMHFLYGDSTWKAMAVIDTLTQIQDSIPPFYVFTNHLQKESFSFKNVTSVKDLSDFSFQLNQNYPNPWNPSTHISFSIPHSGNVSLIIYNSLGQRVQILINKHMERGTHETTMTSKNLSSGVYFYILNLGDYHSVKKLLLLK